MGKGKNIRDKGKIKLSEYFKEIEEGSNVAIVTEKAVVNSFPSRIHGRSGIVIGNRGKYKVVKLKEGNKTKTFIVHPVNLKKL
jgi:large subunit ribosomal protein L21e